MPKRRYKCWVLRSPTGDLYRTDSISDFVKARQKARKEYQICYDQERREKRREDAKARYAKLTPE